MHRTVSGRHRTRGAAYLAAALLAGCAGGRAELPVPSPDEIPELEARLADDPTDLDAALYLASAYREAGRAADAKAVVELQLEQFPDDPGLLAMAGLLAEDAGAWAEARGHYERFLEHASSGALRNEVAARLEVVRREALREEVRRAIAREDEIRDVRPDPRTVGVFPFAFQGADSTWAPLADALSELLITDLALTGRLRVLERLRVRALMDELALAEAGFVEPATAARGGRLLGSGHVVQGVLSVDPGGTVEVDATLVEVRSEGPGSVEPVTASDPVERLFQMEKRLAVDLLTDLGVQLTPAELQRINERQTESVQALLAFGQGLRAADRGDFELARQHFGRAEQLDPDFALASQKRQVAEMAEVAHSPETTRRLTTDAGRLARQRRAVRALRDAPAAVRQRVLRKLDARKRAVLAEVLGQDRVGTVVLLELIFRRPGGTP